MPLQITNSSHPFLDLHYPTRASLLEFRNTYVFLNYMYIYIYIHTYIYMYINNSFSEFLLLVDTCLGWVRYEDSERKSLITNV